MFEPGNVVIVATHVYGQLAGHPPGTLKLNCFSGAFDQDCRVYVGDGEGGWLQGHDDYDRMDG